MPKTSKQQVESGTGINDSIVQDTGEPTTDLLTKQKSIADILGEKIYQGFLSVGITSSVTPAILNSQCNAAKTLMKLHEAQYKFQMMLHALETKRVKLPVQ